MTFISSSAHQKFVQQCQLFLGNPAEAKLLDNGDEKILQLDKDLQALEKLAENYMKTMAQLPALSKDYYELQKRIRIRLRKIQQAELVKHTK